jgi:hypothetical protein
MKIFVASICTVLSMVILTGMGSSAPGDKAKYTIKEVMKIAHKEGLLKEIVAGKKEKKDAEKLVELYSALPKNTPPAGEADAWKTKTKTLIEAAKAVVADPTPEARKALGKAANCAGCHSTFKG